MLAESQHHTQQELAAVEGRNTGRVAVVEHGGGGAVRVLVAVHSRGCQEPAMDVQEPPVSEKLLVHEGTAAHARHVQGGVESRIGDAGAVPGGHGGAAPWGAVHGRCRTYVRHQCLVVRRLDSPHCAPEFELLVPLQRGDRQTACAVVLRCAAHAAETRAVETHAVDASPVRAVYVVNHALHDWAAHAARICTRTRCPQIHPHSLFLVHGERLTTSTAAVVDPHACIPPRVGTAHGAPRCASLHCSCSPPPS